jgi:hypothetical protein
MRIRIRIIGTGNEFQICVAYDHYFTSFSKNTHKNSLNLLFIDKKTKSKAAINLYSPDYCLLVSDSRLTSTVHISLSSRTVLINFCKDYHI